MILLLLFLNIGFLHAQNVDINLILDPDKSTPLSAILELKETNKESIMVVVKGKTKLSSIGVVYPAGFGCELPVHGLYENYTNHVLVKIGDEPTRQYTVITKKMDFKTKPLPTEEGSREDRPFSVSAKVVKDIQEPAQVFNQDLYFTSFPNAYYMMGFDRWGDLRYVHYHENEHPSMIRMTVESNNIYMYYTSDNKYYVKRDLLGNSIFKKRYHAHHDAVDYKDQKELTLGNSEWGWEDAVYEIDKDKNLRKVFYIGDAIRKMTSPEDKELLDKMIFDHQNIYVSNNKSTRVDWAHANSLVYDKKTDLLYVSLRHMGVLAIDYSKWELRWFLVDESLKTADGLKYGQKPKESIYLTDIPSLQKYRLNTEKGQGPRGQHALFLMDNGDLLLFDNKSKGSKNSAGSKVTLYQIDTNNMVAVVKRSFINEARSYSRYTGDVDITGKNNENWLIFYGFASPRRVVEVDPSNNVIFDMILELGSLAYRIDKFPLYPYKDDNKKYSLDYIMP